MDFAICAIAAATFGLTATVLYRILKIEKAQHQCRGDTAEDIRRDSDTKLH